MSENTVPTTWEDVFKHKRFADLNTRAKTAETALTAMTAERDGLQTKLTTSADALTQAQTDLTAAQSGQTEMEKLAADMVTLQKNFTKSETELADERRNALRVKVATANNLPIALAARLQGADEAALTADAVTMAAFAKPVTPGVPPAPNRQPPTGVTAAQMKDPAYVRENASKILAASAAG